MVPKRTTVTTWYVTGAEETVPQAPSWFNQSQDKIYVQPISVPFLEIERKFLTSVVGEVPPDLFEYFGSVSQWSSRGALIPLDDYMKRDNYDRSQIFPALWEEMKWDGKIYAIPTGTACDAFYWNKQHFREAGLDPERPPKTWKELEEYAEKLTIKNSDGSIKRAGFVPGYWSAMGLPIFIYWALQKDAKYLSPDGRKVTLTSPACIEALEWEGKLFEKLGRDELIHLRASFGYGGQHGFASGRVSMIEQKSSFPQELSKYAPSIEYGISMFPTPEGGHPATTSGAVWIGIPAGAEHPDEAWEYIKFYTRSDTAQKSAEYAIDQNIISFFPANIKAAQCPKQMAIPGMPIFLESMKWAQTPTIIPLAHSVFWREYAVAWDEVMRGKKTAREALETAERTIQRSLDDQLTYNDYYLEYMQKHKKIK